MVRLLMDGLKNGVEGERRVLFAHDEHTQAASLRARLDNNRGKLFIVCGAFECFHLRSSNDSPRHGNRRPIINPARNTLALGLW